MLLGKTVDFGATDAFLSDEELAQTAQEILHIPTCLGAVAIIYNLPDNPELRFTPELIADVFLGRIKNWSDPSITSANQTAALPDIDITVVHRSDSSGTSFIFTDYLSRVNALWERSVGRGKIVRWPTGMGVERNHAVADMVKAIHGSIGYVELSYAAENYLPMALVKNGSGNFIKPSLESVSLAAEVELPADTRMIITDTPAPSGYPISAFTYLIFFKEQSYNNRSKEKAVELARFLWWITHNGQPFNGQLLYAPLSLAAVAKTEAIIRTMQYNGRPIVSR